MHNPVFRHKRPVFFRIGHGIPTRLDRINRGFIIWMAEVLSLISKHFMSSTTFTHRNRIAYSIFPICCRAPGSARIDGTPDIYNLLTLSQRDIF